MPETSSPSIGVPQADVREELERALASSAFADSPRLMRFLQYVVEARLAGEDDRIQEYAIGLEVFDRGESFDPRIDSIVRVEARRLRDKLGSYYETDGRDSKTLIRFPRRGYAPSFEARREWIAGQNSRHSRPGRPGRKLAAAGVVAAAIAAAALLFVAPSITELTPTQGTVSFEIHPPPGTRLVPVYSGGATAVSPDGSKIVIVARETATGVRMLYLRSLADARLRPLPGTEGAKWPFWSPDGAKIGFGTDTDLKAIDLDTILVTRLADSLNYRGGSWSSHAGTILFASERPKRLYRVSVGGGLPELLPLTPSPENGSLRWPHFLPDGFSFLYTESSGEELDNKIYLSDLGGRAPKMLLEAQSGAVYGRNARGGYLVFVRDGTLMIQAFDPDEERLISEAKPLVDSIQRATSSHNQHYFSATLTGVLAYRQDSTEHGESELAWFDRAGRRTGSSGEAGQYIYVSLSPDETQAAATILDHSGVNVWTIDLERGTSVRRTEHPSLDRTPVWSPDGKLLLFSSSRTSPSRIYAVPSNGGKVREFLDYQPDEDANDWPSQWSDAAGLVVFFTGASRGRDIWTVRPGGSPEILFSSPGGQLNGRISPDGRLIAYDSNEQGTFEVFLQDYPPSGRKIRISDDGGGFPVWRGDSRELFYLTPDGSIMSVEVGPELDAAPASKLFEVVFPFSPARTVYQYAVTRDGQRFLCVTVKTEPPALVVLNWELLLNP